MLIERKEDIWPSFKAFLARKNATQPRLGGSLDTRGIGNGCYWDIKDLEYWDEKIREKVEEFGLSCYPQEFEICDHFQMLGYMAYSGMPSHYPHWSYGKSYEKLKTMYDYGVSGLPYEMVINFKPRAGLPDAR